MAPPVPEVLLDLERRQLTRAGVDVVVSVSSHDD